MIRVKTVRLFSIEGNSIIIDRMNESLEKFLAFPYKNVVLKYDIQNKIGKAVAGEINSIAEFRNKLIEECGGGEDGAADANRRLVELLNRETELNVSPVPLSLLANEECSGFDFNYLDGFIKDDRGEE